MADGLSILRIFYANLVKRRSTVRITPATEIETSTERPVFIIGLYRSGTTLLRYVLDSHPRLACPPESDFLQVLEPLTHGHAVDGLGYMGYDTEHVLQRARTFAAYFFENYAKSQGKPRWVDKSPLYVDYVDFIERLFPDAQFLVLHRHPLDQVHSLTRGGSIAPEVILRATSESPGSVDIRLRGAEYWSQRTRTLLCRNWQADMLAIRYEDLCQSPEEILRRVFRWLGEDWSPSVLSFSENPHDSGKEAARTRSTRSFEKRNGASTSWPTDLRLACWDLVKEEGRALGYGLDA